MQSKAETVSAYLAELEPDARKTLAVLRRHIKTAAPKAKERMAYGMPSFFAEDAMLFALAVQKQYFALYVCNEKAVARHQKHLGASSAGKSCIRFKKLEQLDLEAVDGLLRDAAGA